METLRCLSCSQAIRADQEAILARLAFPTRIEEAAVRPADPEKPALFHAGCLPMGWLQLAGPMALPQLLQTLR